MITGTHILIFSRDPEADRAFFREVLSFRSIDIGHGWMLFAMPPTEAAFHPTDDLSVSTDACHDHLKTDVYLMCDDVKAVVGSLEAKGIVCAPLAEERWGIRTSIRLPSGSSIGLYQPTHPTALGLEAD